MVDEKKELSLIELMGSLNLYVQRKNVEKIVII